MLWLAITVGTALAFAIKKLFKIAAEKQHPEQQRTTTKQTPPITPIYYPSIPPRWTSTEVAFPHLREDFNNHERPSRVTNERFSTVSPLGLRPQYDKDNTRALLWNWRRSIAGLIFLAQRNMNSARMHLGVKSYDAAAQYASTSVENIARALIHCYGGKPDESSGQEEALRLLSERLEEDEKGKFDEAIRTVACMYAGAMPSDNCSSDPLPARPLSELETRQAVESASKIVKLFQQIMINHFREEIPELLATVQTPQYQVNWESLN